MAVKMFNEQPLAKTELIEDNSENIMIAMTDMYEEFLKLDTENKLAIAQIFETISLEE